MCLPDCCVVNNASLLLCANGTSRLLVQEYLREGQVSLDRVSADEVGVRVEAYGGPCQLIQAAPGTCTDSNMKDLDVGPQSTGTPVSIQIGTGDGDSRVRVQLAAAQPDGKACEDDKAASGEEDKGKSEPAKSSNEQPAASSATHSGPLMQLDDVRRAHEEWVASAEYNVPTLLKYSAAADTSEPWQKRMAAIRRASSMHRLWICCACFTLYCVAYARHGACTPHPMQCW